MTGDEADPRDVMSPHGNPKCVDYYACVSFNNCLFRRSFYAQVKLYINIKSSLPDDVIL